MAGIFWDGFDIYTGTGMSDLWTSINNVNFGTGRFGSGQSIFQGFNGNSGPYRTLLTMSPQIASTTTTFICGFALMVSNAPSATGTVIRFMDGGNQQIELRCNSALKLLIARNGTTLGTSSTALTANQWAWVEVKVKIDNSTGTYEIMQNGVSVLSATGADTQDTGNATIDGLQFWPNGTGTLNAQLNIDDFVFQDDAGGAPSYTGEGKTIALLPNASGNSTQFTPSTGSNWQNVDDMPRDGDTTYNSDGTVGHKDTYNFAAWGVTGVVVGVQMSLCSRKDDVSVRKFKPLCRSGSTDYQGPEITPGSSYAYSRNQWLVDPNTGSAWTPTNLDAAEFGIEITA